jgi:chemotaxis methyl-accepting protein methylase
MEEKRKEELVTSERLKASFAQHSSLPLGPLAAVERTAALRKLEEALAEHYGWAISPSACAKITTAVARKSGRLHVAPEEYCQLAAASESELLALVEEAAPAETYFLREPEQFNYLRGEVLPALIAAHPAEHRLRLWSAACSTGEEAYSLAMVFDQAKPPRSQMQAEVFATDVRNRALLAASRAHYQIPSLRMINAKTRARYFEHTGMTPDAPLNGRYTVISDLRKLVTFRRTNLLDGVFWKGVAHRFDLIVCANLLLYFHGAAVRQMSERLSRSLREDGYLMVAPAESSLVEHSRFKPVKDCPALFRLRA